MKSSLLSPKSIMVQKRELTEAAMNNDVILADVTNS